MDYDLDVTKTPTNPSRTPTQIEQMQEGDQQYFLQVCSNLQNKQVVKETKNQNLNVNEQIIVKNTEDKLRQFDDDSIISQSQSGLQLVYNKFNIVPKHYLLVQKNFIHQLEPIQCLKETVEFLQENDEFTAFYNCGRESGSSQIRQHIQLLELPEFTPLDEAMQNSYLVDNNQKIWNLKLFQGYKHGVIKFRSQYSSKMQDDEYDFTYENVQKVYELLLNYLNVQQIKITQSTFEAIQIHYPMINELQQIIDKTQDDNQIKDKIIYNKSYSLVMTNEYLFICLRSKEGYFNTMSFSGYAFAKNQDIAQKIKENGLYTMLKQCMVSED